MCPPLKKHQGKVPFTGPFSYIRTQGGDLLITISLCMIVKNEEDTLPRCLESVGGLVEEIIVVDTGSDDRTKEAALEYGAKVYDFPWVEDFSKARNFSFSKATQQYCLWLDADDVIDPEYRQGFLELKQALPPQTDVVMLPYHIAFDQSGQPTFTYYRERLIRRLSGLQWRGAVHEAVPPVGNVVYWEKAAVSHRKTRPSDPDRNLRIFEGLLSQGKELAPREQFYYARELASHGREEEAAGLWEEFLASGNGWVENQLEACRDLAQSYLRQGKEKEAFHALTRALAYGPPRAELCCDLGGWFFQRGEYPAAAFWYETALSRPREDQSGAFVSPDCYGYLPCIQLCVCHYRMGNLALSREYNQKAGTFKPDDPAYLYNERFFQGEFSKSP